MMKNDQDTTIEELKKILMKFRNERRWGKFHTPKNLAQALSIESSELMELFLWKKDSQITAYLKKDDFREKVEDEIADILCYCLNFANSAGIDVARAITRKVKKNAKKYPIQKSYLGG